MRRNLIATAATVAVVTATAGFTVLAGSSGSSAAGTRSSAYAFSAEGPLPIAGTPYVESGDGKTYTASAAELPENPLAELAAGTVSAGNNKASVEMLNVGVGGGVFDQLPDVPPELKAQCDQLPDAGVGDLPVPDLPAIPELPVPGLPDLNDLPDQLPADNLRDLCRLLLTPPSSLLELDMMKVSCNGQQGAVEMGPVTVLGQRFEAPLTQLPALPPNPLVNVTVGEETHHPDGSFTITGLKISLGDGAQSITLGSATCAKFKAPTKPNPVDHTPTAPSPTPVPTNLPVTG